MKKITIFILLVLFSSTIYAQGLKKKTADKYFNQLAYASALDYYKDLASSKNATEDDIRKTALCFYFLQDYKNAEFYYDKLLQNYSKNQTIDDIINNIQCKKHHAQYSEIQPLLEMLLAKNNSSIIYKNYAKNANYLKELRKDSAQYKVINLVDLNTEYSEFSPFIDKTQKNVLFASNRRNVSLKNKTFSWDDSYFIDTYIAKQNDSLSFKNIESAKGQVVIKYHDGPSIISEDRKAMYITRTNYVAKKLGQSKSHQVNIQLIVYKQNEKNMWDEGTVFPYCSNEYSLGHAALTKDGKRIYFSSDMPGGLGQTDIWYCDYKDNQWQKPVNMGNEVNTEGTEMFPYVYEDGTLFFSSDGYAGLGGLDICFTPPSLTNDYKTKMLSYPINTRFDDFGFYMNTDIKTGYLSSNREGGKGKDDIYFFRSATVLLGSSIKGTVTDDQEKTPVAGVKLYLLDKDDNLIDTTTTDKNGNYSFRSFTADGKCSIITKERSKYYDNVTPVEKVAAGNNTIDITISPKYYIICTIVDAITLEPIKDVKATLINENTNEKIIFTSSTHGTFKEVVRNKKVGDLLKYSVKLEKEGYITSVQNYEIVLDTNTIINLNAKINCNLQKMEKGTDIGKIVKMNPIYFDLGKFNIRADAAIELDKIIAVMKENPKMTIELGAHTDCRGSDASNMILSQKRAKSSADYIISKGIDKTKIYGKGYGETKPVVQCGCFGNTYPTCSEDKFQENRRTEFLIMKF